MSESKPSLKRALEQGRRAGRIVQSDLVTSRPLRQGGNLPLLVEPTVAEVNLAEWASINKEFIDSRLSYHGGILFRGFKLRTVNDFEIALQTLGSDLIEYSYASTPRTHVSGNVYTSTEYPPDQTIPLHNEMAYARNWPMKIFFFCAQPAEEGGETPIADSRKVYERIDQNVRKRFQERGVLYVRNYGDGLDLSWQKAFQTNSESEVENYCRNAGIEYEWKENDRLRTRQVCQAVATHPKTGEPVWFNQAHLFHVSNLQAEVRAELLDEFCEQDLPRNAYYGDGVPIDSSALEEVREAYRQEAIIFKWEKGDLLMLDNMLAAHGRLPFTGPRTILVGMSEPLA